MEEGPAREQRPDADGREQDATGPSGSAADDSTAYDPYDPYDPAGHAAAGGGSALGEAGIDLLGMDLEALRTTEHPVLSALVDDLRERIAAPEGVALWAFNNSG